MKLPLYSRFDIGCLDELIG